MDKEKTPNPNLSEEISKEVSVNPENQRGLSVSTGKPKMKTENFSPEGETDKKFEVEGWKGVQAEKQKEIDDRLENKNKEPATRTPSRKGFSFKLPKVGLVGLAATVYEVGSQIYDAYKEAKEAEKQNIENKEENIEPEPAAQSQPVNTQGQPQIEGNEINQQNAPFPYDAPEQKPVIKEENEPVSKNEEKLQNPLENTGQPTNEPPREEVEIPQHEAEPSADRMAAFFQADHQMEAERDDFPEISDGQKEGVYMAFNEIEINSPEIEDKVLDFQPAQEQKESLYAAFNEDGERQPEMEDSDAIQQALNVDTDRMAAFLREDSQEVEMVGDVPEISAEGKENLFQTFSEDDETSEIENGLDEYFPVDKFATEDFAKSESRDPEDIEEMDLDVGGADGGDD